MRSYAQITTLILQMIQDTGASTYDSTETGMWIEESLKEFSTYDPHIVDVTFKIESRTGTATATTTDYLEDDTESQFLAADATNEKVIHNTNDHTWAVVTGWTSTSKLGISNDIMASGENYRIYNKRCKNNKQIYIGDVTDYLWIDSVEYPLGTKRNWKVYNEVLEIDVAIVADSDSTQTTKPNIDVLVRFAKPHRLCQLLTLVGACTSTEAVGVTEIELDGLGSTEIIVEGSDELHIADHRTLYTVTTGGTTSAGGVTISVFPGMESATADGDEVTFVKSTLKPQHEELFCHLVAARAVLSDNIRHIDAIPKGGADVWMRYQTWGERKLGETLGKLDRLSPPRTKRIYTRW